MLTATVVTIAELAAVTATLIVAVRVGRWVAARRRSRAFAALTTRRRPIKIEVVRGDITREHVDVIVNAAKSSLMGGGGVDGAIHRAGGPAILDECRMVRSALYPTGLPAGQAVATTGGDLPAPWVVHTVGPVYNPARDQAAILRSCYTEALACADRLGAASVAFPLISAGVYGWPKADAVTQALTALTSATTNVRTVRLVIFDQEAYRIAENITTKEN